MKRLIVTGIAAAALCVGIAAPPSFAEEPTVGIVAAFSGPYAEWGQDYKREIDLWMHRNNGKHGYPKVNLILRDAPGISNIARTKQVVQGFIVRDHAAVVGGGEFTPEALAVAPLVTEAKIPYVIFNGATSFITDHSPYLVLSGFTIWQADVPMAEFAAEHGCKHAVIMIANYAPGDDSIDAYAYGLKKHGAKVSAVIKVPMGTADFSSYMERLKNAHPQCVLPFMPGGPMSLAFLKDFAQMGFPQRHVMLYDASGIVAENQLGAIGNLALGIISSAVYDTYLDNPVNKSFIAGLTKKYPNIRHEFATTDAYVGMHIIFHMLKATHGERNAKVAMASLKGWHWMSPRGPVFIDPKTHDIVQDVYISKVVKGKGGTLHNKEFKVFKHVHDPWHELHGKK
ncbi:MAG: ABC transporter substrate-binding protein [Stellaceae bacterium]